MRRSPMPGPDHDKIRAWRADSKPLRRGPSLRPVGVPARWEGTTEPGLAGVRDIASARRATVTPLRPGSRDTGPDAATRKLVLERDGYACVCCGRSIIGQRYSLQHRKRRSQGGSNSPVNLIVVLGWGGEACHGRIDHRDDPEDEEKGYTVRSGDDPALISVMIFSEFDSGATKYLTEDGQYSDFPPDGSAA